MERYALLVKATADPGAVVLSHRTLRPLGAEEVLVKIHRAAICGTDLHILQWNDWAAKSYALPLALGHEFSGHVVDRGAAVHDLAPGDKVAAETHLACGDCSQCRIGRGHTCRNLRVFSRLDCGAFAQYAIVPAPLLRVLPAQLPHKHACLMEPLGIAVRAVLESQAGSGELLVVGCGPIGLLAIAAARALGVSRIAAMDLSHSRLQLARAMGADHLVDPAQPGAVEQLGAVLQDGGAGAAIDASGSPQGIAAALSAIRPGGTLVLAGIPNGPVSLDLGRHVILHEVAVRGIYGRRLWHTWEETERLLPRLATALDCLVTHEFPLEQFEDAFAVATSGHAGKVQFMIAD